MGKVNNSPADYFQASVEQFQKLLVKKTFNEKSIHDLRVAARKIKTLAADFAVFCPGDCWELRRLAAKVIRKLAPIRERQLFENFVIELKLVLAVSAVQPGTAIEPLAEISDCQRDKFHNRYQRCCKILRQPVDNWLLIKATDNWRQEFSTLVDASRPDLTDEQLHQIRIAAKKLRYRLECFAPQETKRIDCLTNLQTEIGALHDLLIFSRMLAATDIAPADYDNTCAYLGQKIKYHRERALTILNSK